MAVVHIADVGVLVGQRVMEMAMAVPEGLARLEPREILRSVGVEVVRVAAPWVVEVAVLVLEFGVAVPVVMAGSQQQRCAGRHGGRRQQQRWRER
jgi:hypothetical protein